MKKMKWIGLTLAGLGAVASGNALAHMQVESDGGLKVFNTHDNAHWFALNGRVDLDQTIFSGGTKDKQNNFANSGNIRNALLGLSGGVGENMTYGLTLNFDGSNARFQEAWVGACADYTGPVDKASVKAGQFVVPTTMDSAGNFGTKNSNMFLEQSLSNMAFQGPARAFGVSGQLSAMDMFTLTGAVYQPEHSTTTVASSTTNYGDAGRSDRLGTAVRVTYAPVHTDDTVFHAGLLGRFQSYNSTVSGAPVFTGPRFATVPEAVGRNTATLLDTGALRSRSSNRVAVEALGIMGPASLQAEYNQVRVQRVPLQTLATAQQNPRFHGWHVQAGYVLTGETRGYDFASGTLHAPKVASKCGAWEIAARFSYADLINKDIYGGSEHNTTLGVNWFVNDNVRLAANYIRANIKPTGTTAGAQPADGSKRQLNIFGLRLGVNF